MTRAVNKRTYTSVIRREQAAQTRSRIVAAAAELFLDQGYAATTVQAIAARAEVAPDTVYAVFTSKVRVLTAVIDARLAPPGVGNVMDRPEATAIRDEPDQRRQIQRFAADMAALSVHVRPVFALLRAAADTEPEVRAVHTEMEQHRLANMTRFVEWVAARGPLALDLDDAARTVWALAGPDVAGLLCDVGGWGPTEHAAWLDETLTRALLPGT